MSALDFGHLFVSNEEPAVEYCPFLPRPLVKYRKWKLVTSTFVAYIYHKDADDFFKKKEAPWYWEVKYTTDRRARGEAGQEDTYEKAAETVCRRAVGGYGLMAYEIISRIEKDKTEVEAMEAMAALGIKTE